MLKPSRGGRVSDKYLTENSGILSKLAITWGHRIGRQGV